jgi:hypothetical protein
MPKKEGENMIRVNFTLAKGDRDMLAEMARSDGVSNSDMLRRLILLAYAKRDKMQAEPEQERIHA